jgi:drug/metabolite transporter (DMT)-like permease
MVIIYKSLLAAVVTAVILLIEKHSGPRIAGAIGGIPIVFAITFVLITYQEKNIAQMSEFLWGGVIGACAGILFSLLLIFLNKNFTHHYWLNFVATYVLCFFFALLVSQYSKELRI